MNPHRDRDAFLREAHIAVLATRGADGRPHAAPIWYLYEDGVFVMITGRRSTKARNIRQHPQVALVVDQRTLPYYVVMVQGTAAIGLPPSREVHLHMAVRYLGEAMGREYSARRFSEDAVTIRLLPGKLTEYHGVTGRRQRT